MTRLFAIFLIFLTTACSHSIHQVYVSDYEPYSGVKKGKDIRVNTEQLVIFHFKFDTDYVEQAYANLQKQCRNGDIKGITTQYSTSHGFFSWTNKILMQGKCIR